MSWYDEMLSRSKTQVKDIPELVEQLVKMEKLKKDCVVPLDQMKFSLDEAEQFRGGDSSPKVPTLHLSIQEKDEKGNPKGDPATYPIEPQALTYVSKTLDIPKQYLDRMIYSLPELAVESTNEWLNHMNEKRKGQTRFIRLMEGWVRGFLSPRFRALDHLALVTQIVQVVTGQDGESGKAEPWARGARSVNWSLTPSNLHLCLVNPAIWVDLENLDKGVQTDSPDDAEVMRRVFRKGLANDTTDWTDSVVYPSVRASNSETGFGGLYLTPGLCEGFCINLNYYGTQLKKYHVGKEMEAGEYSAKTYEKMNEVIFAQAGDVTRQMFEPENFLIHCKKFKQLETVTVTNITDAVDNIVKIPGLTEGLRDDILAKYAGYKQVRKSETDNLFNLNSALTDVAKSVDADTAVILQDLSGTMVQQKRLVLA